MVGRGGIGPVARRAALLVSAIMVIACTAPTVPQQTVAPVEPTAPPATPTTVPVATAVPVTPALQPTSTPQPTDPPATPAATTTAAATPTPTTAVPTPVGELVLDEAEIVRHLDALAAIAGAHGGERSPDSSGYDASADYVAEELAALGFDIDRQAVDFTSFRENSVVLEIGDRSWSAPEWLHANIYSAEGRSRISDYLQTVGIAGGEPTATSGCAADDWDDFAGGSIAIVFGGVCSRRDVVLLAQNHDASALISLYPDWERDGVLQPTLFDPEGIHTLAVVAGREPSEALLAAAVAGTPASLSLDVDHGTGLDDNILAELPGSTDRVLVLGGHLDSVLGGPGLNDNGSGVATLMALAAELAERPQPELTIRLAFWAAEEFGTHGSSFYVEHLSDAERERIDAYVNLDMVGSPNAGYYVYDDDADPVSSDITDSIVAALSESGISSVGIPTGGSDHVAFWQAGVPFGGVFSGIAPLTQEEAQRFGGLAGEPADPCYHLPCDGRANVDTATAMVFGNAIGAVVEELAY